MADAVKTPIGMLMFTHLFVPKSRSKDAGKDPDYNFLLVFNKEAQATPQFAGLKKAMAAAIDAKWGVGKSTDASFVKKLQLPLKDAADKDQYSGFEPGFKYISAWTKTKPGIVDGNLQDITVPSDVWAGQLGRASVAAYAWENSGKRGVSFMLNNVQITKADMPRMDGRRDAKNDFDKTEDAGDAGDDSDSVF